jgi:hypothetical protein
MKKLQLAMQIEKGLVFIICISFSTQPKIEDSFSKSILAGNKRHQA